MHSGVEVITKRMAISKTNAQLVIIVAGAAFVVIFCLITSKTLFSQNRYQQKVIDAANLTNTQLQTNLSNYTELAANYKTFTSGTTNILGGQASSTGDNGGDNGKLILDALPPTYDFPALASSVEAILTNQGLDVSGLGGTDNQLTEENNNSSQTPTPVIIPFNFALENMNYNTVGSVFTSLQQSIRPIAVDSLSLSGGGGQMTLSVQAHTYYQPAVKYGVSQQVVPKGAVR